MLATGKTPAATGSISVTAAGVDYVPPWGESFRGQHRSLILGSGS